MLQIAQMMTAASGRDMLTADGIISEIHLPVEQRDYRKS